MTTQTFYTIEVLAPVVETVKAHASDMGDEIDSLLAVYGPALVVSVTEREVEVGTWAEVD